MKLYTYWRSSSAWRVRIALHLKGLSFESVPVHLLQDGGQQTSEAYRKINPMAQVPCLELTEHGKTHFMTQSMAIIEYLDEVHPKPPLLSSDPGTRYRARQIAEIINSGIQPMQNLRVLRAVDAWGGDRKAWIQPFMEKGLAAVEALLDPKSGPFALGERPTLADVFIVPQLYGARRFGVELSGMAGLLRIERSAEAHPAFRAAHPSAQPDAPEQQ
ncbi:MAG: maleylacetoacetate isomerase [Myxococcota bacterium]